MISATVSGERELDERLRGFAARLDTRLSTVLRRVGEDLREAVRRKLDGEALQSRSGHLAAAVELDLAAAKGQVTASVGVDTRAVPYAAYQEYGFRGTETVRAHLRTIKEAFGRPIAPHTVEVRSYSRAVDYPAHSFLRTALAELAPSIPGLISETVDQVAAGT